MANPDGLAHWYNDRWYEYTGLPFEELEGWKWGNLVEPSYLPTLIHKWETSVATGIPYECTAPVRSASGEYRMFYITAAPLRDSNGSIVQWFGTNTDVNELHKVQEELIAADRRKDNFLPMLAHELRNPLAPINTAAELLKLANPNKDRLQKISEIINRQIAHMRELLDDLLDVSRVTRGLVTLREEILELKAVVAEAVEQVQPLIDTKRQQLVIEIPESALSVKGDRTRLTQILTNLLNNAAKYTPDGGNIAVRLNASDSQIEVTVQDSGIGISPDLLPHVFELFTQGERSADRSQGGLGLGLALVKNLVELHGGTITAASAGTGRGSEFTVRLPRLAETCVEAKQHNRSPHPISSKTAARILIVDDNADAAEALALLLETLGHSISIEHDAQQALDKARRTGPEFIFLDIGLPEITGYELAPRLRTMPEMSNTKIIAVSGYGQPEDRERARQVGFDHYLVKPVSLESILGLMK